VTVYSCPWCGSDLEPDAYALYCRACQATITYPAVTGDTDD
jgi:hypothetical protein